MELNLNMANTWCKNNNNHDHFFDDLYDQLTSSFFIFLASLGPEAADPDCRSEPVGDEIRRPASLTLLVKDPDPGLLLFLSLGDEERRCK